MFGLFGLRPIFPFQSKLQEIKAAALAEDFDRVYEKDGNVECCSREVIMLDKITLGLPKVCNVVLVHFTQ